MSSKHSECDENLTEEFGDKTLNVENTTTTHLEDQPSHSSINSDTKSTNEEILMQSEIEQSNNKRSDNIVAISNIECDKDITDIAVESHGGKLIEEKVGSDTNRESDRKQVSLMVETHSGSINVNKILPNQPNEITMQSETEQSNNKQSDTIVITSNISCDKDITDIAIENHGSKLIEEKNNSDTDRESDRKQVSLMVETHSDSINGNTIFPNQPNEIAIQSKTEQSNNKQSDTIVKTSNISCDKDITDITIESHGDKLIEEKIESDTNKESDRKQVSSIVDTHSDSIKGNNIFPNQPNEIAMQSEIEQSNNEHSDTIVTISKIECDKNITDFPVESHGDKLIEETIDSSTDRESDRKQDSLMVETHSGSVNIISILPNQPNEILDTIEDIKDKVSNANVKEQQPLEEKTPLQGQGDIENEMDVDLLPTAEQKQITEEKAKDKSIMDAEGVHKKQESCGDMESDYVNNDDNESMTISSNNIKEDISVDSKTVSSNTDTPVKDLETIVESDMTYGNTEDDKFKLIWEDDDDDSENISETTHKIASSDIQVDVSEIENSNIAQTNLDNESFDTTITSNSSFLPSKEHGLNKPDVMLEIPMQDLGEFSDDNDDCGQEHLLGLAMSPDVDKGACDELDKSSIPSVGKEAKELVAAEIDLKNGTQNISSNVLEYVNRNYETSTNNQDQLEYPNHNKEHNGSFPKRNKSPSPIVQIEKDTKDENHFSTIVKDKVEQISGEVKEMDGNQDISETKCNDIQGKENQKEDIEPQPSTSALSEDNTLENMPQNPDVEEMSDSLGLLAESSRVMDDDEQEEEQDDDGDDDDDSDADDDNSNQMTGENSEDSNVQHTEVDTKEVKNDTPTTSDKEASEDGMNIDDVVPDTVDLNVDEIVIEEATVEDIQVEETDINAVDEVQNDEDYTDNNEQDPVQEAEEIEESVDVPVDIETVKLSDTSDTEMDEKDETNIVEIETNEAASGDNVLDITNYKIADDIVIKGTNKNVLDCVYLEASSSDEEVCEVKKKESESTTVKMPADIDVISSSGGATSDIVMKETETVIRGLPKPPPLKPARINTSEVSIKTTHTTKETFTPPDVKKESSDPVVNLDSDDEEREKPTKTESISLGEEKVLSGIRCVNKKCPHNPAAQYSIADSRAVALFEGDKKKRSYVCEDCYHIVHQKNQELITGILDFKPLMDFDIGNYHEDLVEISDSESEEETEPLKDGGDLIGDKTAKFLEDNLTDIFNDMWTKYRMDDRLEDTQAQLQEDLKRLQKESLEIDELFKQCQNANDKLRKELYATFEPDIHELPGIVITDDGESLQISSENDNKPLPIPENNYTQSTQSKRPRRSTVGWWEPPTKKQAIPMGYTPISTTETEAQAPPEKVDDDNTDISVVKLSLEAAPADLPPPGPLSRAPLRVGMLVYAKKKASWLRATITEILPSKNTAEPFTMCRVKFEHNNLKDPFSTVSGRHLAYSTPAVTRMIIGTRVIALFKDMGIREYYSAGIVAEVPNPVNNYRYLIFFDDGYAQYAAHRETRAVCQSSPLVWEEVHVDSRQFVKDYITSYPERPMVRLHAGQNLKTEFKGKWLSCVVEAVDASLVRVAFADGRREWIYRGSTRLAPLFLELQAAERSRPRAAPRAMPRPLANKGNMPYVEYTRSNEQTKGADARAQNAEEIRRQRSVAKKSTAASQPPPAPATNLDDVTSRVVFYTPKNAVKPNKMVPHKCGPQCRRTDVLQLKDLRTYNPLAKPLLSGWERQVVRWRGHKEVMYVGGCGRRLRNMAELHRYLRVTRSDMSVDLFDFSPHTHCLAEFVLNRCIVSKKDLSNGKENVPIPCVNYYDHSLPEFYSYNTERTPTAGVPLNLDPDFLCGCDCEDDCQDKSKCACWQLTLEGARTIRMEGDVGYVYKRLPKPVPSGIYECNSRCKCKHTCLNRVAQHPLQLKLQVFKTLNKGWGIRALNDVPEGSFLCVYAGNLLTDATATLDGLNEGDEFLAELDYIEVVEQMKEGYEEDIPEDGNDQDKEDLSESSSEESSEEEKKSMDEDDVDFMPSYIGPGLTDFTKRLRKRDKKNARDKNKNKKENDKSQKSRDKAEKNDEDCITISDDESREPSCFTAAAGMRANEFVSKYKSVRTLYGEDEACYIMDAKVQGNIGRYLNHSCTPNVFVQNVFVDTHDPRFPWVAFFALSHVRAGTELTWNYNYDVGSVPGKVLYCLCGAPNCKGRLL